MPILLGSKVHLERKSISLRISLVMSEQITLPCCYPQEYHLPPKPALQLISARIRKLPWLITTNCYPAPAPQVQLSREHIFKPECGRHPGQLNVYKSSMGSYGYRRSTTLTQLDYAGRVFWTPSHVCSISAYWTIEDLLFLIIPQ